jgi:hypothetical protein
VFLGVSQTNKPIVQTNKVFRGRAFMKRHKLFCIAVFSLTLAGLLSAAALGQSAAISGTVADETGGILPGVEVTLTNTERGTTRNTISDDEGRYSVPELQLGGYQVEAALTGFQTAVRDGITLTVGRHAVVNLVLSIGEITERVVVTGEAATVDTTSSTISGLVDEAKIRDLPLNGRSFSDLVTLQMGTAVLPIGAKNSASGFGAKISISGARPSANSFLLDGSYLNDTLNNTPAGATGLMPSPSRAPMNCTAMSSTFIETVPWMHETSLTRTV